MPIRDGSYVGWLLPPGDYEAHIEPSAVLFDDVQIRGWWLMITPVPWFPGAGLYNVSKAHTGKGRILIGSESADEFHVTDPDNTAMKQILRYFKQVYDEQGTAPFTLHITHDSLVRNQYNEEQKAEMDRDELERCKRESIMKEIYG